MTTSGRKTPTSTGTARRAPTKKSAARKTATPGHADGPPSLTMAHAKGFLAGALAGVIIGAGGVTYLSKEAADGPQPITLSSDNEAPTDTKPRFDFYTLLPNQDLDFSSDVEPAELRGKTSSDDQFILQAGSFRAEKDADRRRGELALLGLEATIELTRGSNGVWYRVYLGPFESRSAMAKARSMTAQQSIDTLLMKRPRTP